MSTAFDNRLGLLPLEHHASFFKLCIAAMAEQSDSEGFLQWMLQTGAKLMPQLSNQLPGSIGTAEQFFRVMARRIWESTPRPQHNFMIETLPLPERKEPCYCGSGRKFRQCCAEFQRFAPYLPELNMLPFFLASLPEGRWHELANSQIPIPLLADQAQQMLLGHRSTQVLLLLEPWFVNGKQPWPEDHWPLLQHLLVAYQQQNQTDKEERMARLATFHAARPFRSVGWLHLANLLSNQIRLAEAWDALHHAEEYAPDHPDVARIEVTLLLRQENWEQASRRGHFWALRFARLYGDAMAGTIDLLNRMAENPQHFFAQQTLDYSAQLAALIALVQDAPAPECAYHFVPQQNGDGKLEPGPHLQEALDEWYQIYTFLPQQPALEGVPYDLAWEMAGDWMPLLTQRPILWSSFEVLDDLTRMIAHGQPQQTKATNLPLVERSAALFDVVVAQLHNPDVVLNWDMVENRPAMLLAIEHLEDLIDRGEREPIILWLEKMLFCFHRSDEQHWREILMPYYLEAGRYQDAVLLAEHYPNDIINMRYDHALALFMLERIDAANAALKQALAVYPLIAMTLLARTTAQQSRKIDVDDRLDLTTAYCETHIGLWPAAALDWLEARFSLTGTP
jgi:tetratricopeptide (TPR) repeat protein